MDAATDTGRLDVSLQGDGRYHRQELITWWEQERLREARVLVVGAGALGNELVKNLTLLGVGTIVVADLDTVENSNLSRCVFFREADEGRPKARVVAEAARELNPDVRVIPVVGDIRRTLGVGLFAAMDVVLGGLDNREARLHVNQCCWKTSTPWVDGAIEGLMGVVRSFVPPYSACYECTLSDVDYKLLAARRACSLLTREKMLGGKVPTVATTGSVIAGMQAQEAVKLLHATDGNYDFGGRGFLFNGLTHDSYTVVYERREDCLSHDTYELGDAERWEPDRPLGELVRNGSVVELEAEIVIALECTECDTREDVLRPLLDITAEDARCPRCGNERRLEPAHRIDASTPELHEATPEALGLPPLDVITVRDGARRRHLVVAAEGEEPLDAVHV